MDILIPEFKRILLVLIKHDVRFMLIGGYAVIFHGYERSTSDMDIWLEPTEENKDAFINAFKEINVNESTIEQLQKLDFSQPQVFYFGESPKRIDFLTKIQQVEFLKLSINLVIFQLLTNKLKSLITTILSQVKFLQVD
ncbi:MAG: hypothetical protein IPO63_13830 [Bacteroidetes bacterium]|nr:hypothetical protein [Bacteroidota bacterium]